MPHIDNWVEDSARGRMRPRIGVIESEYPQHVGSLIGASGIANFAIGGGTSLLVIPSGFMFKPRTIIALGFSGTPATITAPNGFVLYCGSTDWASTQATIGIWAIPTYPAPIQMDGINCAGTLMVSGFIGSGSMLVRIAGILVASTWEN